MLILVKTARSSYNGSFIEYDWDNLEDMILNTENIEQVRSLVSADRDISLVYMKDQELRFQVLMTVKEFYELVEKARKG